MYKNRIKQKLFLEYIKEKNINSTEKEVENITEFFCRDDITYVKEDLKDFYSNNKFEEEINKRIKILIEVINNKKGFKVKEILKSEQSISKYIIFEKPNGDIETIRISDHDIYNRKANVLKFFLKDSLEENVKELQYYLNKPIGISRKEIKKQKKKNKVKIKPKIFYKIKKQEILKQLKTVESLKISGSITQKDAIEIMKNFGELRNRQTGDTAQINRDQRDSIVKGKIKSGEIEKIKNNGFSEQEYYLVCSNLDKLFEKAVLKSDVNDLEKNSNILHEKLYISKCLINNKQSYTEILVRFLKETNNGRIKEIELKKF